MSGWRDLTLEIHPDVPKMSFLPCPVMDQVSEAGEGSLQLTNLSFVSHTGTHFDAACHAIVDGTSIEEYSIDRWITSGLVINVDVDPLSAIELDQLRQYRGDVRTGDAILIRSGWEARTNDDSYQEHPYISEDAAKWLVEQGVNWVGVDFLTVDKPSKVREDGFDYPIHNALLGNDVLVAENLTNLDELCGQRVDIVALPLPLRGLDGSPARIVARPQDSTSTE